MSVEVMIHGFRFQVDEYAWYTYLTEASSGGNAHWFASTDIDECRHFIETIIAKDGGMAKIEMWDLTCKSAPSLERLVTTITCTAELPKVVFRKPPDAARNPSQ